MAYTKRDKIIDELGLEMFDCVKTTAKNEQIIQDTLLTLIRIELEIGLDNVEVCFDFDYTRFYNLEDVVHIIGSDTNGVLYIDTNSLNKGVC